MEIIDLNEEQSELLENMLDEFTKLLGTISTGKC